MAGLRAWLAVAFVLAIVGERPENQSEDAND